MINRAACERQMSWDSGESGLGGVDAGHRSTCCSLENLILSPQWTVRNAGNSEKAWARLLERKLKDKIEKYGLYKKTWQSGLLIWI